MNAVATANAIIFAIICAIAIYSGLNPKKWQTWLLSLYSFLTFFLVGTVGTGNFYESAALGVVVTFALIFGGITTFWNRERAKKWLKEHRADEK